MTGKNILSLHRERTFLPINCFLFAKNKQSSVALFPPKLIVYGNDRETSKLTKSRDYYFVKNHIPFLKECISSRKAFAFINDFHSGELNNIWNHFLSAFFMKIFLYSHSEATVKSNSMGNEISQKEKGLPVIIGTLHQNVQ